MIQKRNISSVWMEPRLSGYAEKVQGLKQLKKVTLQPEKNLKGKPDIRYGNK